MTIDVLLPRVTDTRSPKSRIIQRAQKWLHKKPLPSLEPVDISGKLYALAAQDLDECSSPSPSNSDVENIDAHVREIAVHEIAPLDDVSLTQSLSLAQNSSPHINKIPVEILGQIFIYCLPTDFYKIPYKRAAPLLLCQVSVFWKEVALAMPGLWSSLSFYRSSHRRAHRSLLNLWLNRSDGCPLSLRLTQSLQSDKPARCAEVLGLFMDHATRWRHVSFELDDDLCQQVLSIPTGSLPILESVSLDLRRCCSAVIAQLANMMRSYPGIHRLALQTTSTTELSCIPWDQLSHVHLSCPITLNECVEILVRCIRVEDFTLRRMKPSSVLSPREPIVLSHLHSLSLLSHCDIGDFFNQVSLPVLRELHIRHENMGAVSRNWKAFEDVLSRSSCQLHSLFLMDSTLLEEDLIGYLSVASMRSLRRLVVHCKQVSDRTLLALKVPSISSEDILILPHLESLELKHCSTSFTDGLFTDMVTSRWKPTNVRMISGHVLPTASLKAVTPPFLPSRSAVYHDSPVIHERDREELEKCSELGLEVYYGSQFVDCEGSWTAL